MGVAKRYLVKTSMAVRICVKPFDGVKGPTRSICRMSPGKLVFDVISCSGGRRCLLSMGVTCAHTIQFFIQS